MTIIKNIENRKGGNKNLKELARLNSIKYIECTRCYIYSL